MNLATIRKVQEKFLLSIPKEIREFLGIQPGDNMRVKREGDKIIFQKAESKEDDF